MSPARNITIAFLAILITTAAFADQPRLYYSLGDDVIHGAPVMQGKAGGDTINLMASHGDPTNGPGEPHYFGDFEDAQGNPALNGWTGLDVTQPDTHHWQVSNYGWADPGNLAAWCGDINIASCDDSLDPVGGYGNAWHDILEFRHTVPDPFSSTLATITAHLQIDVEPGYDFVYFSRPNTTTGFTNLQIWDGARTVDLDDAVVFAPGDYLNGTDVVLQFRFKSDGGWSDADCSWPTIRGAFQVDDITVNLVNGIHDLDFFTDFQDGTYGDWAPAFPPGVGDFFQIWTGLLDVYPCIDNFTPQAAFIDDGVIVPGTGGSDCINWCYGPFGNIVTTTGGLAGPDEHIYNLIESPVMDWPNDSYDGTLVRFGVFRHEDLSADAPGMFYMWSVRSADTDGSAGHGVQLIEDQPWMDRSFVYYGGPDYIFTGGEVTDLMNPGRDQVQLQCGVYELGWIWGWAGNDGYPAPYFDNMKVQVYPYLGPGISSREIDLANDGFPERGSVEFDDLGSLSVRFDMARNIALASHMWTDFGDSMVVDIVPVRQGAELFGTPEIHYIVQQNSVFDPYRTSGLPAAGSVPGTPALGQSGIWDRTTWAFDLPDTGFLFPGDVLHYFIRAEDAVGGADVIAAIMPADTTGFHEFGDPLGYNSTFTIHALPTVLSDGFGGYETPPILFWNDFANRGGEQEWYTALRMTGLRPGEGFDIYYTNGPSSGVGNGLGGRAGSFLPLEHYTEILYTAGDLGVNTLSNGDFQNDSSDDVGVLDDWLKLGGKDLFLTGDDLASDLAINGGALALQFAEDNMGVSFQQQDVRSFIDNQTYPVVKSYPGNPVFQNVASWIASGGCFGINTFDGVTVRGSAQRLAEFTDPGGSIGAYPYSAATLNIPEVPGTSRVVSLPYDFMFIGTDTSGKAGAPLAGRSLMLRDVIAFFGLPFDNHPAEAPPTLAFSARNHPNPFNPATRIVYTVPKAGHLSLKIYDIRGRLVRTLVDERVEAGADQVAVWDGRDSGGSAVSSGVYFYEARAGGDVKVGKMALVK